MTIRHRLAVALLAGLHLPALPASAVESADCLVLPGSTIEIGGTIPGQIASVSVDVGDVVAAGQIVASLRTEVQEAVLALAALRATNSAAIDAARARFDYEVKALARSERLRKRGILPASDTEERETAYEIRRRELEEAETELELARLDLLRAEAELEIRRIRSPIDGVVAERHLDPSEYLRDDGKVLTIVSLDPLRVDVFLPQAEYRSIAFGARVMIETEMLEGEEVAGRVAAIDKVIDAASATFRVRLSLPNPDGRIVAGTRCTAKFP